MNRWPMLFALAAAACGSAAPEAVPASTPIVERRPVKVVAELDDSRASPTSAVSVSPEIAEACKMPSPHFAFDSSSLAPSPDLDALAACFATGAMKGRSMRLVGHADPRGETEYNFALGQKRAGSVLDYLALHGLTRERLMATSRGELDATGVDEAGWALDRRVDILLGDRP